MRELILERISQIQQHQKNNGKIIGTPLKIYEAFSDKELLHNFEELVWIDYSSVVDNDE